VAVGWAVQGGHLTAMEAKHTASLSLPPALPPHAPPQTAWEGQMVPPPPRHLQPPTRPHYVLPPPQHMPPPALAWVQQGD
jgi:hypothetical protein